MDIFGGVIIRLSHIVSLKKLPSGIPWRSNGWDSVLLLPEAWV